MSHPPAQPATAASGRASRRGAPPTTTSHPPTHPLELPTHNTAPSPGCRAAQVLSRLERKSLTTCKVCGPRPAEV